jgi:hypothetical protein
MSYEIRFGGESTDFLSISVFGRESPDDRDYWDGNWLIAQVEVKTDQFSGRVSGTIRAEELQQLYEELQVLNTTLTGEITYMTLEAWISFRLYADELGHLKLTGTLKDDLRNDNYLVFAIGFDQTFLRKPLKQLQQITAQFPIVGKR